MIRTSRWEELSDSEVVALARWLTGGDVRRLPASACSLALIEDLVGAIERLVEQRDGDGLRRVLATVEVAASNRTEEVRRLSARRRRRPPADLYLVEGRVRIVEARRSDVRATCRSDGTIRRVEFAGGGWFCSCGAETGCDHVNAVARVTAPKAVGTW